jgi:hypothetical protein
MLFVVGLILTPVGAFVATMAFEIAASTAIGAIGSSLFSTDMLVVFIAVWLTYALAYTAPVTLTALPLVYTALRRRAALTTGRLIAAGMAAAIVLMWAYIGVSEFLSERREFKPERVAAFTLIGVLTGLVVGAAFAYIMRWKRPADWSGTIGAAGATSVT